MDSAALCFDDKGSIEQEFEASNKQITRIIRTPESEYRAVVERTRRLKSPEKDFFASSLDCRVEYETPVSEKIRYIDVFCGGGGLSLGVHEGLRLLGYEPKCALASDLDAKAMSVVEAQFRPSLTRNTFVEHIVDYQTDYSGQLDRFIQSPTINDDEIIAYRGKVDLVIGGPPCQGHSNFNNRSRGSDPRNLLYFTLPALAIALEAPKLIIENVKTIRNSSENVVEISKKILRGYGYEVEEIVLNAKDFGIAQSRERHFLLANLEEKFDVLSVANSMKTDGLTFADVNSKLKRTKCSNEYFEINGQLSDENIRRIAYLHENDLNDLPNAERPECHRNGHTYPSVYGRIIPNEPALTITQGFASPGRGRFIHPTEQRVINNREASRLQGFPDWYWECEAVEALSRKDFHKIIGEAVPPGLVTPLVVALFG